MQKRLERKIITDALHIALRVMVEDHNHSPTVLWDAEVHRISDGEIQIRLRTHPNGIRYFLVRVSEQM